MDHVKKILALLGSLVWASAALAVPPLLYDKTQEPPGTAIYAKAYGVKANGTASDDVAMVTAAAACNTVGGHLILPPGTILLDGTGGNSIVLNGCWMSGSGGLASFYGKPQGTTFNITSTTVTPFKVEANVTISNASFYWPNQTSGLTVYPPLFADGGVGNLMRHPSIHDITVINAYDGILITPGIGAADGKITNNTMYCTHACFSLHSLGDSWVFANNRFTPGPWLNILNASNAVKTAIDAAALQNAVFKITAGTSAWFNSVGGQIFDFRYVVYVDSGGQLANSIIDMGIDGTATMIDSSSGGIVTNQNVFTGSVSNCASHAYLTNSTFGNAPCFNLGDGSGIRINNVMFNGAYGSFIEGANNNSVDIHGLTMSHVGTVADGSEYYFARFLGTQNAFRMWGSAISGKASGVDAHEHGIYFASANPVASGNFVLEGNLFTFMSDVLTVNTNQKLVINDNTSLSTYASGATLTLTGAGSIIYTGNYWDITPASLLTVAGAGTTAGSFTTLDATGAVNLDTGTSTSTTTIGNTQGTGSGLTINAPTTVSLGGNLSQASWGTTGIGVYYAPGTYNDTTTGSGGVTTDAFMGFAAPTFTNTQGTANVLTNGINVFFGLPVCGAGWASCTNLYSAWFAGKVGAFCGATINGGTIALNASSSSNVTNIGTGSTSGTVTIGGGSNAVAIQGVSAFGLRDTSAAFDVTLAAVSSSALSAGRTLTVDMKNVAHTLALNSTANTITFPNTASYTLIGSGDTGTVTNTMLAGGVTLANLAAQATNTVVANVTSGTAVPTATAVVTCSTAGSALKWTTNTGFGCNTAINAVTSTGVTDASAAAAGVVGELFSMNCPAGTTAAVTMTIASPAVLTWTTHPWAAVGATNWTCAINFTTSGALPTGVVAGTNYYLIGSTASGDTVQISDTAPHAMAGTNAVNTSGTQSGTQTGFIGALATTSTSYAGAGLQVTAGDWDCSGTSEYQNLTALTATSWQSGIATGVALALPSWVQSRTASGSISTNNVYMAAPMTQENVSVATNVFIVDFPVFSAGTLNAGGFLRCRRMR